MNLPEWRWVRRWSVRVLDTCAQACFRLGLALLVAHDALEPPPPLPADLFPKILDRIRAE